jgi:hypothetical protein
LLLPPAEGSVLKKAALLALSGAVIAGCFGILHDQTTYTISPEYFTRMKFDQFRRADFGFPPRVFVAEIGFLATWWVGLIAAWFLARVALPKFESPGKQVMVAMAVIVVVTVLSGTAGYFAGPGLLGNRPGWRDALDSFGVLDATAFNRVAGIHLGSYLGAFWGWVAMMVVFVVRPRTTPASPSDTRTPRSSSPSR